MSIFNRLRNCVIVSWHTKNGAKAADSLALSRELGGSLGIVCGVYRGETESAHVFDLPDDDEIDFGGLARRYGQECVLVSARGLARLVYSDGRSEQIGELSEVSEIVDNCTIVDGKIVRWG